MLIVIILILVELRQQLLTSTRRSPLQHRLFVEHEKALKEAARLDMELERLTVERRAQATPLRVEQIARQQLQMRNPPPGITQYVAAPGAGLATAGAAQGAKP